MERPSQQRPRSSSPSWLVAAARADVLAPREWQLFVRPQGPLAARALSSPPGNRVALPSMMESSAERNARANALNADSSTWWALVPRTLCNDSSPPR
eukprot:CAMPEP_0181184150 /NCGR_PEP_ID=MMETSP1096-20121128/8809_1 /TAXON_ID=156174 ORGANISM="Chrysochromulina ericina, Strain CCMP281" /NCGR_SAMPLE_ID=MMETSP1096 /ASSEMBLY_ACC=CAM_ASM_000453 /LENGTH=96 /DNA_ID=CAMNT_0023272885 /DNA_START=1457 /DNA_END=1746 /DNA_ORIENTATION=-